MKDFFETVGAIVTGFVVAASIGFSILWIFPTRSDAYIKDYMVCETITTKFSIDKNRECLFIGLK
jgi:hypothetical protein